MPGKRLISFLYSIEKANPTLKGVLPKDYARPALDKTRLGELIDLIGTIELVARDDAGLFGPRDHRSKDILGRVYEYFLGRFAAAEGKAGGESFTPRSIDRLPPRSHAIGAGPVWTRFVTAFTTAPIPPH